jgi:hypothetical protein
MKTFPHYGLLIFFLLAICSFVAENKIDGDSRKLRRIEDYKSLTHIDLDYDSAGRLLSIRFPYGAKTFFTYSDSLAFIKHLNQYGKMFYDTALINNFWMPDSVFSARQSEIFKYDKGGNIVEENYIKTKSKKRKPANKYTYHWEYYNQSDSLNASTIIKLRNEGKRTDKLVKRVIGIEPNGDTTYWFDYKYRCDSTAIIIGRNTYYRTGQLYDSIGYIYY